MDADRAEYRFSLNIFSERLRKLEDTKEKTTEKTKKEDKPKPKLETPSKKKTVQGTKKPKKN